jgi:hypothetical protein
VPRKVPRGAGYLCAPLRTDCAMTCTVPAQLITTSAHAAHSSAKAALVQSARPSPLLPADTAVTSPAVTPAPQFGTSTSPWHVHYGQKSFRVINYHAVASFPVSFDRAACTACPRHTPALSPCTHLPSTPGVCAVRRPLRSRSAPATSASSPGVTTRPACGEGPARPARTEAPLACL